MLFYYRNIEIEVTLNFTLGIAKIITSLEIWMRDSIFMYPLFLSLTSALIFWLTFSFLPFQTRKRKIRPIVEHDLITILNKLFSLFDCIMRHTHNSPSFYQHKIRGGFLERDTINPTTSFMYLHNRFLFFFSGVKDKRCDFFSEPRKSIQ